MLYIDFFFIVVCCKVSIGWVLKAIPHHQFPGVWQIFNALLDVYRSWCFFVLLQPGTRVLFHVIHILQRKNFVMTLQCQWMLGGDKHQASSSLERKKKWSMAILWRWSIVTLVCYIGLLVAPIAPFATIAWSVLITIAPGWANALDWYFV